MDVDTLARFEAVPVPTPAGGRLVVELVPAPDPWDVARRLAHLPHLLFLDSAEREGERGRYSYVSADPQSSFRYTVKAQPAIDPVAILRRQLLEHPSGLLDHLPPFQCGLAGLFGYGFGRQFERLPEARYNEFGFPDVAVGWYDWVVSFDHAANRAWVLSSGYPRTRPNTWQTRARNRIQFVLDHLSDDSPPLPRVTHFVDPSPTRVGPPGLAPQYPLPDFPGVTSNFDRAG